MINTSAYVSPYAKLGERVELGAFSTISDDVEIGEGTWIGPNVTVMDGTRIGKHCRIFPGAVISAPPQDLKYRGETTTVTIGDGTVIRECVTINRGTALDKNNTHVGSNCLLMAYVHVAHDCIVSDHVILSNMVQLAGHVTIDEHAFFGGVSAVHQFVRIGAYSMISGGSLVRKDVPPYITAAREPLSYAGVNAVGLKRKGFTTDKINEIQDIYRTVYLSDMNTSDALRYLKTNQPASAERDYILKFIEESKRGIIRGTAAY